VQSDDKTRAVFHTLAHNEISLCQHHNYWHTRWIHTNVVECGRVPQFTCRTSGLGDVYTKEEHLVILLVVGIDVGVWIAFWNKWYNLESLRYTRACSRYDIFKKCLFALDMWTYDVCGIDVHHVDTWYCCCVVWVRRTSKRNSTRTVV